MTAPGPDLGALLHADPPGPLPDGFAARVDAAASRLRSRARRRRVLLTGAAAVAAVAAAGSVLVSGADGASDGDVLRPAAPAPTGPRSVVVMPDLTGMDSAATERALEPYRYRQTVPVRYVASNDVPVGRLLAQSPAPGTLVGDDTPVVLTFSAGGPAVPLGDVPAPARAVLAGALREGELVLVLPTSGGNGYKTDDLLTGPCPVTARLYRDLAFADPVYDDRCYG